MAAGGEENLPVFHNETGKFIKLLDNNRTAVRTHSSSEFNNGVVFSKDPLINDVVFSVKIQTKVTSWTGSLEIGVTVSEPGTFQIPLSAASIGGETWILSGQSILHSGQKCVDQYYTGTLEDLAVGDVVGVERTSEGELHFWVNGVDHGCAASNLPGVVYAVVDLYGQCSNVCVVNSDTAGEASQEEKFDMPEQTKEDVGGTPSNEQLRFHEHCGRLAKLTNNNRTVERLNYLEEFNNSIVLTNRPLRDDELFEICLDSVVEKWSGSLEIGVTTHNPASLEFPNTMSNMRTGTIMMSGADIITNGGGTKSNYGQFSLDQLMQGDRIGVKRTADGNLVFVINGLEQGIAAPGVPNNIYGVVDLYGMAVKICIIDYPVTESVTTDVNMRTETLSIQQSEQQPHNDETTLIDEAACIIETPQNNDTVLISDTPLLKFHSKCGASVEIAKDSCMAFRPNSLEDFNNGVVLTDRPLRPDEPFVIRIDRLVEKWAGSIEIGVTTHCPDTLTFPSTMTNIRSGTWMMTSNGVMHNGVTVMEEYGSNLEKIRVGDNVGVVRYSNGEIHFLVNNIDQGTAAYNTPDTLYGVVDLYGQAAEASIINSIDEPSTVTNTETDDHCDIERPTTPTPIPTPQIIETPPTLPPVIVSSVETSVVSSVIVDELRFHSLHGRNAIITNNSLTACRPNAINEFNDAIVMSHRTLQPDEMFEIIIERMVDRWTGSIEAGVTVIHPENLSFPNTMTDIDYDTWMLSGSAVMQNGATLRNNYPLDLDSIRMASRLGIIRRSDGNLHFYIDGNDVGVACSDVPPDVYAVIDLYGQCVQVTLVTPSNPAPALITALLENATDFYRNTSPQVSLHVFHTVCGRNVTMEKETTATRSRSFDHGLVFSQHPLRTDEMFQVVIKKIETQWSGSLSIGLTSFFNPVDNTSTSHIPPDASDIRVIPTFIIQGSKVKKNGIVIKENYTPHLDRLRVDNTIGIKRCKDSTLHLYINNEDMGPAAASVPEGLHAVVDLYGMVESVSIISSTLSPTTAVHTSVPTTSTTSTTPHNQVDVGHTPPAPISADLIFHEKHGKHVLMSASGQSAYRFSSYNNGLVFSSGPLVKDTLFQIQVDRVNPQWSSSILVGLISTSPDKLINYPSTALSIKRNCWLVHEDCVFHNGFKIEEGYGPNLDNLTVGHRVGVLIDSNNCLHLYVNGVDQGIAADNIPPSCYTIIDLYGQCEQVSVVRDGEGESSNLDHREKADVVDGMKESIRRSGRILNRNCEYQSLCSRFKACLALPDGFFEADSKSGVCYCESCYKLRGDELFSSQGDPPRQYTLPFGWCRFPLRLHPNVRTYTLSVWHMAYHATYVGALRKILDNAELLVPSELSPCRSTTDDTKRMGIVPTSFENHILLSPTCDYISQELYSEPVRFIDPKTEKAHSAKVALQVYVRPGCYTNNTVTGASVTPDSENTSSWNSEDVKWFTKEKGATILTSLLVEVQ